MKNRERNAKQTKPKQNKPKDTKKQNNITQQREYKRKRKKKETTAELKILYTNINGIKGKMKSLKTTIENSQANIITLTETKSKPPNIDGFTNWHAKNRTNKQGGGVAITLKSDLKNNAIKLENTDFTNQEVVWIELKQNQTEKLFIGTYYGKQESAKEEELEEEYDNLRDQITRLKQGQIILAGDFNAKLKIDKNDKQQNESRNGKYLRELIEFHDLIPITLHSKDGTWTRERRTKNRTEKSTIDYILISRSLENLVQENIVDEQGIYKLKGLKQTDHHTLILTIKVPLQRKVTKVWNLKNIEQWKNYNQELINLVESKQPANITELTKIMQTSMKRTIGEITITEGNIRKEKDTPEIKTARKTRNMEKKIYENTYKNKTNNEDTVKQALDKYIDTQAKLKELIEQKNTKISTEKLQTLIKNNVTTKEFWKTRSKVTGNKDKEPYDTITEEGETITSQKRTIDYIADYYENLYQAREGDEKNKKWTEELLNKIKEIEEEMKTKPNIPEITLQEIKTQIKKLKRRKAIGPDKIPYEVFIEANDETLEIYRKYLNKLIYEHEIPEIWGEGEVMRNYKGKNKTKGKCSSERGITFASNFEKLLERIINERIKNIIKITEAQLGGKQGASTADHLILMKEMITEAKNGNKPLYMVFLDVEKAYDKAWLDGIMYTLYNNGITDGHWALIKALNSNLTARIQTKYGLTRKINIKDSLRQGGVLSGIMYGSQMDEINKEIKKQKGEIIDNNKANGVLLWVDDVLETNVNNGKLQNMLDITEEVSDKYRIYYGKDKSNILKIGGNQKEQLTNKIAQINPLEQKQKYKYLGHIQNSKNNLSDQIQEIKQKLEAIYQTIIQVTTDETLARIEMKTIFSYINYNIIPIITSTSECWNHTKK